MQRPTRTKEQPKAKHQRTQELPHEFGKNPGCSDGKIRIWTTQLQTKGRTLLFLDGKLHESQSLPEH